MYAYFILDVLSYVCFSIFMFKLRSGNLLINDNDDDYDVETNRNW